MTTTQSKTQLVALERVRQAQDKVNRAKTAAKLVEKTKLIPAIEHAHDVGISLREIAKVLNVSHVTVLRMLTIETGT